MSTYAISAWVHEEDGAYVRTIRRNVRKEDLPEVLAKLEQEPQLSHIEPYVEGFG